MDSFVTQPLDKILNRENIVSRLERAEAASQPSPSSRVVALGEVSQFTGTLIVDELIVLNQDDGVGDITLNQFGIFFRNQEGELTFFDTAGGGTLSMYADGDNWIILSNQFGDKGIAFLIDDASHGVKQFDFNANGDIDIPGSYLINEINILTLIPRSGQMINGKITPTVVSSDLVLTLQTAGGATPSTTDPVYININGTVRTVTAATSCTLADGTNWFNSGASELAANAIDYFAYAVWDSNSSVVAIAPARIPWARLVSDFSATTTNEKHIGNYANYTTTDDVCVIGRFQATLSSVASSHVWSVPTFTNANLIQEPIFETQWRDWIPSYSCSGSLTYTTVSTIAARYIIREKTIEIVLSATGTLGGSASTRIGFTLPFEGEQSGIATPPVIGAGWNGNANTMCVAFLVGATPDRCDLFNYNLGNWATSGTATIRATGMYEAD